MPDVPPGNLRALVEALHELHARAGWPSTRELSKGRNFSHTAVHDLFTKTTAAAPRPTVLLDVVERLASISRRLKVSQTIDRFDSLWEAAHTAPFITEFFEEMGYTASNARAEAKEPESAGLPAAAARQRDPANLPPLEVKLLELVADGQPWEQIVSQRLGDKRLAHYRN